MITVTELRIFAFPLSWSQEYQSKHILLSTVIQTPVTFLLRSPFGSNVPDHPLVSISSAELWAISSTEWKVLLIHALSLQVEHLHLWAADGVQGQFLNQMS